MHPLVSAPLSHVKQTGRLVLLRACCSLRDDAEAGEDAGRVLLAWSGQAKKKSPTAVPSMIGAEIDGEVMGEIATSHCSIVVVGAGNEAVREHVDAVRVSERFSARWRRRAADGPGLSAEWRRLFVSRAHDRLSHKGHLACRSALRQARERLSKRL